MGKSFRDTLNERLADPEFRAEWNALEQERQILSVIIEYESKHVEEENSRKLPET